MGLDALELILGWEDAFDVKFTDEEVFTIRTPKMAIDLIADKVGASSDRIGVCPTMRSYHCIRQALQSIVGLNRQQVRLDSKLRPLLPKNQRQEIWHQLRYQVGVPTFPSFGFGVGLLFPPVTVQNLVDWTVIRYPRHFVNPDEEWTRFHVRSVVRAVVRDALGVTDFRDESDFARELGVGW